MRGEGGLCCEGRRGRWEAGELESRGPWSQVKVPTCNCIEQAQAELQVTKEGNAHTSWV